MEPLDAKRLSAYSSTTIHIGRVIETWATIPSTNDLCHERAGERTGSGLVIAAEHQSAGRGQRGRTWTAPSGSSLLFSILLDPPRSLDTPNYLVAWGASAITTVLRRLGLRAVIKWPNDVLIRGRKACGILVEKRQATVVGVGLNVELDPESLPADVRLPATSVAAELERSIDRTELFIDILRELDESYTAALAHGPGPLWEIWPQLAEDLLGRKVVVQRTGDSVRGRLIDWRPDRGVTIDRKEAMEHIPAERVVRVEAVERDQASIE